MNEWQADRQRERQADRDRQITNQTKISQNLELERHKVHSLLVYIQVKWNNMYENKCKNYLCLYIMYQNERYDFHFVHDDFTFIWKAQFLNYWFI